MITDAREQLLRIIEEISNRYPDMRLGQLLTNLATAARGPEIESIWDAEDEELVTAAQQFVEHLRNRHVDAA